MFEQRWTPQRVADLRQMLNVDGLNYREIAKRMGYTKNSIIGAAHRYCKDFTKTKKAKDPVEKPVPEPKTRQHGALSINFKKKYREIKKKMVAKPGKVSWPPPYGMCCAVLGEPREFIACGVKTANGKQYCQEHMYAFYVVQVKK